MRQLPEAVEALELARHRGNLALLVEVDALRPELGRQEAQEAGAGADVGHGRLALDDDAGERRVERGVAHAVGEQGAVIFDAHEAVRW